MPVYAVQRNLPGITMEQLGDAQKAAIETSNQFTEKGTPVRYIRSTFVPGDSTCTCLFEGPSADAVKQVNDTASLPYERIVEAMDLTPQ